LAKPEEDFEGIIIDSEAQSIDIMDPNLSEQKLGLLGSVFSDLFNISPLKESHGSSNSSLR
jgi:hypothetical protein